MELKDIAAISGKPGLFRIVKPTRNGVIVETLDDKKRKIAISATQRISILKEITMYTTTEEDSIPLEDVLQSIHEKKGFGIEVEVQMPSRLHEFMVEVFPDYDKERVYDSDIKKLIKWYNILGEFAPAVIENIGKEEEEAAEETVEEESADEEKKA